MSEKLEIQQVAVKEKSDACEELLTNITAKTEQAQQLAQAKSVEIEEQNNVIAVEKAEAEAALAEALPALEEAKRALDDLERGDVTEIR